MKIVSKVSVKTVVGAIPTQDAKVPKMLNGTVVLGPDNVAVMETVQRGIKQNVMRVFGQCDKIKTANSNFGETVEFQGQFEATNILDGEIYRGNRLYLPPVLTDMVRDQVLFALETAEIKAKETGIEFDGKAGVQFAFDIGIDSANNAHGYQYTITPLTAPSQTDALSQMKNALLANAPALPAIAAPKTTPATTAQADTGAANEAEKTADKKAAKK